jgi:hypothetical protein
MCISSEGEDMNEEKAGLKFVIEIYEDESSILRNSRGDELATHPGSNPSTSKGEELHKPGSLVNKSGEATWGASSPVCVWYNGHLYCY